MPRLPRVVVPGAPQHVTRRGNRRQTTFFADTDYHFYLATLARVSRRWDVDIWAYCLMPNQVHFNLVPTTTNSLTRTVGPGAHGEFRSRSPGAGRTQSTATSAHGYPRSAKNA